MQNICLIHTSVSSQSEARILASDLIDARLAACVQITGPGLSIYRWQGKVEQADEYYIHIKTTSEHSDRVVSWLEQHHPYELPEIICLECEATETYVNWLRACVAETKTS